MAVFLQSIVSCELCVLLLCCIREYILTLPVLKWHITDNMQKVYAAQACKRTNGSCVMTVKSLEISEFIMIS